MSVNKVILIGNLGADPEVRQTQGNPVCNMRIATNEKWTDREGNRKERTEWHSVTVWGRMGENCARYLSKGRQVYVEGRLQSREWEDQSGNKRRSWDIVASSVQFLSGEQGSNRGSGGGWDRPDPKPQQSGGWGRSAQQQTQQSQGSGWGDKGGWGQSKGGADPIPF